MKAIDGLDRLKLLPGVESVLLHHPPGAEIDPRHGTRNYLFAVVGSAADYAGVLAVEEFLQTEITAIVNSTHPGGGFGGGFGRAGLPARAVGRFRSPARSPSAH